MRSRWLQASSVAYALLICTALGQDGTGSENTGEIDDNGTSDNATDTAITGGNSSTSVPADCSCGFLDPLTGRSYTDSLIVYFNETGGLGDAFNVSSYEHAYEKGWGKYWREGALESNVYYANGSTWNMSPGWLNLNVSGRTSKHLVNGAEIETKRQDMLYGSFRGLLRSAAPYASGGSALTMRLLHNESLSADLSLLSMDDSGNTAKFAATTNGQPPLPENSVNYTTLLGSDYNQSPWDFWEYRMDWDENNIEWYAGVNKTRTMPAANWTLPVSFSLKHWSLGYTGWTEGPPVNDSGAAIGWMRLFFNSSVTSPESRSPDCTTESYCSTEDETLRTITPYTLDMERLPADLLVKPEKDKQTFSGVAIGLAIASVVVTSILIVFGLSQKATVKRPATRPPLKAHQSDVELSEMKILGKGSPGQFISNYERTSLRPDADKHQSTISEDPSLSQYDSYTASSVSLNVAKTPFDSQDKLQYSSSVRNQDNADDITPVEPSNVYSSFSFPDSHGSSQHQRESFKGLDSTVSQVTPVDTKVDDVQAHRGTVAAQNNAGIAGAVPGAYDSVKPPAAAVSPAAAAQVPQQRTRVDYLAGLVALCSILVATTHFVLTFAPSTVMEYIDQHYKSEYWARRTIEPFFFNNIWTGLFFTTSTRFLTTGYLRKGDLKYIAEKAVCRTPRFMIPIVSVILFEYFMMDVGAVTYLEYLPSITWSPWPSTSVYPNFGWFFNETLQLIYLIPNAAPQLTWNYCTGESTSCILKVQIRS